MKRIIICLIILLAVVPTEARTVELTLYPAKSSKPEQKYQLLAKADEQNNADAAVLYEKAIQSLPSSLKMDEIEQWLNAPPDKLPRKQVQSILERLKPTLQLLEQATKCKQCDWPYLDDDALSENLRKHRRILFLLALKVRLQIAQGQYDEAIGTMQAGFAMAKHLGADSSVVRGLVGIAVAAYVCRQIEQFVQKPDAPNLYEALRHLPQPFIDLTEQVEWEDPDIKERIHLLMNRLDRHVAALQCIEAMRLYMAAHNGMFPSRLSDVTLVTVPDDPATRKPFVYNRTGSKAVLESPATKGARIKDAMRYELNLKE
jgi:tetratricopeptide (TPR) repeat protein